MIVEIIRLLVTLTATAAGFLIGDRAGGVGPIAGAVVGAGVGYVFGGVFGRLVGRALDLAPRALAPRVTGPQLFAGAFGVALGLLIGLVLALPLWVFLPVVVGLPLGALVVLLSAAFAGSLFAGRAEELLGAVGLRPRKPLVAKTAAQAGRVYVIDSSAAIDGRVLELGRASLVGGRVWVPLFVVDELHAIADAADRNRRRRGRRGLDVLDALRDVHGVDLTVIEDSVPQIVEVDAKLVHIASEADATLVTTDHNLAKVASVQGVAVLNPHAVGEALRPQLGVGERVSIVVERVGSEPGQGIGYLDDGTMVVVDGAASMVGETMNVEVTNALRTQVGRMVFARAA